MSGSTRKPASETSPSEVRTQAGHDAAKIDLGLYDSWTLDDLKPLYIKDVSSHQTGHEQALLVYTEARRGPIVQLQMDGTRIHYFYRERSGRLMIDDDTSRFGFSPGALIALVDLGHEERAALARAEGK